MNNLPVPIIEDLIELTTRDRQIAYLELDVHGVLISSGGELDAFGFDSFDTGTLVEHQVDLFTGLLNPENLPLYLPFVELPSGITADIHLFNKDEHMWILLMHTEEKKKHHQAIQQKVYDLRLTHNRQTQIVNQYLGKEVAERLDESLKKVSQAGERRNLTVMFADLRGFTSFSENTSPEQVFDVLNHYLSRMIPEVLNQRGVLDKIIGDEIMAIFGMLDEHHDGPRDALIAAVNILSAVEALNSERLEKGEAVLQIGIGIATGPVSLGVLGSEHRKSLTVIGNHVNLAARLQGQAAAKQLMIDDASYQATPDYRLYFSPIEVQLKGYSKALNVHLLDLDALDKLEQHVSQAEETSAPS